MPLRCADRDDADLAGLRHLRRAPRALHADVEMAARDLERGVGA